MNPCARCGTDRTLVGVRFPARLLCKCEKKRKCSYLSCKANAVAVEFQTRTATPKDDAPGVGDRTASLLCTGHAPEGLERVKEPTAAVESPVAPTRKARRGPVHIDPIWEELGLKLPMAESTQVVSCVACKDQHMMKQRLMHNGTYSECPRCRDSMIVLPND